MHAQAAIDAFGQGRERGQQIAVELDDIQIGAGIEQRYRDGAAPGADLEQPFPGMRRDRVDDGGDDAGRMQEVLSQAFLGCGLRAQERRLSAAIMSSAVRSAWIRLPVSALPLPARSRAVPWSTEVRMIGRPSVTFTASPKP
jgi:hypothetical protein